MKYFISSILVLCSAFYSFAQNNSSYWQQHVDYTINVTLDDKSNTLKEIAVVYKNNAPETLDYIWFHIWPNAYKMTIQLYFSS